MSENPAAYNNSDSLSSWGLVRNALSNIAALNDTSGDGSRHGNDLLASEDSESLSELGDIHIKRYESLGTLDDLEKAIAAYTRALEVTPEGKPDMRIRVINYGSALHSRSIQCGDPVSDFEIAVFAFTFAVEVTPDDDPDKPRILCLLGASLQNRLQRLPTQFRVEDVDNAIAAHRRAVELTPAGHPEKSWRLSRLGNSLIYRFQRLHFDRGSETLDSAIEAYRQAVELTPDEHRDKPSRLAELATSLIYRFQHLRRMEDLEDAIATVRRAIDTAPDGHIRKSEWQYNVADYLHMRFMRSGEPDDLKSAIAEMRRAIEMTPEASPLKPWQLNRLGVFLLSMFEIRDNVDDLEESIAFHSKANDLTLDDDPEKSQRLSCLGSAFFRRYQRSGDLGDLDKAITSARHATELSTRYWDQAWLYDNLGHYAWVRWERCSDVSDLDTAIAANEKVVKFTTHGDADKPRKLSNLGMALSCRFRRSTELGDLEKLVETTRLAADLSSDGDYNKPWRLHELGESLQTRYERMYELDDLEGAIGAHRRAVDGILDDHPDKVSWLSSLSISLGSRFERLGDPEDLESSLKAAHRADELTPDGHPLKPHGLNNVAVALWRRFERHTGDIHDLQNAITTQRRAVDLISDEDPAKPMRLCTLAIFLRARFQFTKDSVDDLQAAETLHSCAMELSPDRHPDNSWLLEKFGDCLRSRFEYEKTKETFEATIKCYMDAAGQAQGSPYCRLRSAESCVRLLTHYPTFSSPETLLLAHSHIMTVIPDITWLGYTMKRRLDELARMGGLVGAAVSAAIAVNDVRRAVAWLEAGRTLVWSQIMTISTPTDELREIRPDLAEAIWDIQFKLVNAGFGIDFGQRKTSNEDVSLVTTPISEDGLYRRLVVEYERIVNQIRQCPGFEDFLRPKSFETLRSSLTRAAGPVVFLNVTASRCDAVILSSQYAKIVTLPSLTESNAQKLRARWLDGLRAYGVRVRAAGPSAGRGGLRDIPSRVLELLWKWIMLPVLDALGVVPMDDSLDRELRHVIWCPTGPLLQLPLHAAGLYGVRNPLKKPGSRISDFVVSSYAPSLSALDRCLRCDQEVVATPNVLVVTQPNTPRPGLSRLPCVTEESACIRRILPPGPGHTFLHQEEATVLSTLEAVNEHPWVHFACHGSQNLDDPTLSAFELHDGPLTLAGLMTDRTAANSELAFLSACQTAKGDEKVPEESMHLAAGMLAVGFKGVVATMWSIKDEDAPVVVEAYYKKLLELRMSGTLPRGQTGAARALHEAAKCLREKVGEDAFERWVPFIHFGA